MNTILARITLFLLLCLPAMAQTDGSEIFLKSIPSGFQTVGVKHDEDGNTYVLGNRSGGAVITKFDPSGNNVTGQDINIAGFQAKAFDVVGRGSSGFILVVSNVGARKFSLSGSQLATLPSFRLTGISVTDVVYAKATQRMLVSIQRGGVPPVFEVYDANFNFVRFIVLGALGTTEVTIRSLAVDDTGAVYASGKTGTNSGILSPWFVNSWTTYNPTANQHAPNTRYLAKINSALTSYTAIQPTSLYRVNEVRFANGWLYLLGGMGDALGNPIPGIMRLERYDTSLNYNRAAIFSNSNYHLTNNPIPLNLDKFGISADASDNVYLTGYLPTGTTKFIDGKTLDNEHRSAASTSESAFVAKLDSDLKYEWVKTPILGPFPAMGSHLDVSWDAKFSRLWWTGSFEGANGLTMQEGANSSTTKRLPVEIGNFQGYVAAFEPSGAFTEVVNFTLTTDYAANRILLNGAVISNPGGTQSLILNSDISIKSPRTVYQWDNAPVVGGSSPDFETDDIENKAITIENAVRRYTFLNFSVNSVVQDSNATVYNFKLNRDTAVKLEWLAEFALTVDSNLGGTVSRATVPPNHAPLIPALTSKASGNPIPSVGKHWIRKDAPVVMEINGAMDDLAAQPGLAVRYVPWRYRVTGAAIVAAGGDFRTFPTVSPRQQVPEFSMSGPASIVYDWKLQYGIDATASNIAANPDLFVEMRAEPPNFTTPQSNIIGSGVSWYDDGTRVLIGAPSRMVLNSGPLDLAGWFNGDNTIFSPSEGNFSPTSADPLTAAQRNAGFSSFTFGGKQYIGRDVILSRPARVVWNYSESIIIKNIAIGAFVDFTAQEIADFGLDTNQSPVLSGSQQGGPSANDFIWDNVAKKFFPVRPITMDLVWPANGGRQAKVRINPTFRVTNYQHIASTPPVQLVPQPPVGQPRDLVFQKIAFTTAAAQIDNDAGFTATAAGWTVLQFNRITPAGRGGTAQNAVELKVVNTKQWNSELPATVDATIGNKITSTRDRAGLGTGYVFFANARYNPFIYDRTRFSGAAIWNKAEPPGPVIAVNQNPTASPERQDAFVIVWYDDPSRNDYLLWPYTAEQFNPVWPTSSPRILMSSGFGSESVAVNGNDQVIMPSMVVNNQTIPAATTFDPGRFEQVQIYQQPIPNQPGYNPNEEHALMAPSLRFASVAPRPLAAYAMRENDLNITSRNSTYTSDPYVLVQFRDKADNEFKMRAFIVQRADVNRYPNGFTATVKAGEPVVPFYPLGVVSGAQLPEQNYAREGNVNRVVYWKDHKNTAWAVSGDGTFSHYFYYPLAPDFWWPDISKPVGTPVAWLPENSTVRAASAFAINYTRTDQTPLAQSVSYTTTWPLTVPTIKVGETLTFSGGEYAQDNPGNPGLPGVLAWDAGEVVFDSLNPDMREGSFNPDGFTFNRYTARVVSALEQRSVALPVARFPTALLPATGRTRVLGTIYQFEQLSSSLKKRVFFDPLAGRLFIKGLLNDKDIGDSTLTAAPPAVYALEPNILTATERDELLGVSPNSPYADLSTNTTWREAINALFRISRNPMANTTANSNGFTNSRMSASGNYTVGLEVQKLYNASTRQSTINTSAAQPLKARGPGLALVTNPGFLDPNDTSLPDVSYVTLAENNDPDLGGSPVVLHVVKVDRRERYRGAIKVVLSNNVFDENIILRHTGDFGANPDDLVFDWWYRVEDGTSAPPPDAIPAGQTNPWKLFTDPSGNLGRRFSQLTLKGNPQAPELLLADSLWFVRYRHRNELPTNPISWQSTRPIPYQWAGAGNSRPSDYRAQLAQGWVKRVLDAVNPYEARIRDFTGDAPATYSSMIQQFGQRYEGPVALNPDKNVIENVGLIELYSTILHRARSLSIDLSTPVSTPGISNALMLASTRLADFYMLLGNEAYADAKDTTIGFTQDSPEYGVLAPTIFTFQNQLDSQLAEELGLLRGVDDFKARPVYNRLFWNFTKGEGEAAYATSYNISDVNTDGFIDEKDAMILFPQGHGDAWGHYLTAIKGQYGLLNNPFFNWVSRSEQYNLMDIVLDVDFLDERKFAQVAAAKAKTGAEIVNLSYREKFVDDPESQWQGYIDTDRKRAWGVEGWARRAGQGAYFDWVTANALIPSVHPNSSFTGIRKVDRTTVKDIAVVSAQMNAIQQTFDEANNGLNPLGISGNTVPFDIDPTYLEVGSGMQGASHFEQIYDRAAEALENAAVVLNNANGYQARVRDNENSEIDFRREVFEQDMAYRNELIEIFGTPYSNTIGSGGAYPSGYSGPDTGLYMYVDRQSREISSRTVPGMTAGFMADINNINTDFKSFTKAKFRSDYSPSFSNENPSDWFNNFNGVNYVTTSTNGITFNSDSARVKLTNMQLPIKASGYTFEAPSTWGRRSSPGKLQMQISAMIQQEAELAKAIAAWDGFQGSVVRQLRIISAQIDADKNIRGLMGGKIANNTILGATLVGLKSVANTVDWFADLTPDTIAAVGEFVPKNLPTAGFAFSPGDALSAVRGATFTGAQAAKGVLKAVVVAAKGVTDLTELTKDLIDMGLDFEIDGQERNLALKQALVELENMVGDEGILRVDIYRQQELLREMSDRYRATLQQGARLIDEREAYNKRVAEMVQRNRYNDMSFRVTRNAALERYNEAFNLAARYVYLAAKAYDYETNLKATDPGSAQLMLTKIVRERNLGMITDGIPRQGHGGLTEHLSTLKANFTVLESQLGINNPQQETGRFSLRSEHFRISPKDEGDDAWRDSLAAKKVDNLWDMPEFRRYCRPFSAYDPNVKEPGLVIDFTSMVTSGKNFFGQPLAGGDNAYDPTNYATKIASVGAWFEGYVSDGFSTGLSQTPRVYLVPVGSDVMMYPSDEKLGVRMWKVLDQKIPVPFPVTGSNLNDVNWRPLDTLGGTDGELRRFSSIRAYPDSGFFEEGEMTFDTRLIGRSVWNTRWLLIIPGKTLRDDADAALDTFIDNVTDIKLYFQTYGTSGN